MKNWVKIQTLDLIHQAELRVQILKEHDIDAVIVNEKDSIFLLGGIDLYVNADDEKKAKSLIDEFDGLTKINSFIEKKPILLFQKILQDNGIQSELKRTQDKRYVYDNYELYVKNEDILLAAPFVTGEKLTEWEIIAQTKKLRHSKSYFEILNNNQITALTIKKKDSDFHLEVINIYVKKENAEQSKKLLEELNGWVKIYENENHNKIEEKEKVIVKEEYRTIIRHKNEIFELFVENVNLKEAQELLSLEVKWVELGNFKNINNALYIKSLLKSENVKSIVVNDKDSVFLLGEIELYVMEEDFEKASKILKETK
jgi:glutathionyl-hydroquinone reductase